MTTPPTFEIFSRPPNIGSNWDVCQSRSHVSVERIGVNRKISCRTTATYEDAPARAWFVATSLGDCVAHAMGLPLSFPLAERSGSISSPTYFETRNRIACQNSGAICISLSRATSWASPLTPSALSISFLLSR